MNLKRVKVVNADEGNWYENHIGEVFWVYDALNTRGEYTVNNDLGGYYIHKDHCVDVAQGLLNLSRSEFERYVDDGEMTHQDILDLWDEAVAAEAKEKKLREEMGILSIKVKILFLTNYVYSDSSFEVLDELILPLNDAKELVNKGVAVIDYIYS